MSQSSKQLINSADRSVGKIGCGRDLESRFNPTNGYSDASEFLREGDDYDGYVHGGCGLGAASAAPNKKQKRLAQRSHRPHRPHLKRRRKGPLAIGGPFRRLEKAERRRGGRGVHIKAIKGIALVGAKNVSPLRRAIINFTDLCLDITDLLIEGLHL